MRLYIKHIYIYIYNPRKVDLGLDKKVIIQGEYRISNGYLRRS